MGAMADRQPDADQPSDSDEEPDSDEQPEAQPSGVGADAAAKRTLCRSSTDRVIAGVAGGIGDYFGIDSVIVRIAFIVLSFLGGAGPFLYLIGWMLLPREDSRSVITDALGGDSQRRFRSLLAVGIIGLGLLMTASLSGEFFELFANVWRVAPFLALILIAAGVALVLWPGPSSRHKPTPARPGTTPTPAPGAPMSSSAYSATAPHPPTSAGPEWAAASPSGPPPAVAAPVLPTKARRARSVVGSLTVAVLLVYAGAVLMLERLDAFEIDIGVFFAIAVAITGAGLLVSAFVGPARGLIMLGVGLCAPLFLFVGADLPWGSGVGEVRVSVTDVEELEDEYRHGIGQLVVDLRSLDPERTDHSVDLSLGIGELRVYVPDTISTTADIKVGAGNIGERGGGWLVDGGEDGLGIGRTIKVPVSGETIGELRLDIDVGIGEAEVVTVPGTSTGTTDS